MKMSSSMNKSNKKLGQKMIAIQVILQMINWLEIFEAKAKIFFNLILVEDRARYMQNDEYQYCFVFCFLALKTIIPMKEKSHNGVATHSQ